MAFAELSAGITDLSDKLLDGEARENSIRLFKTLQSRVTEAADSLYTPAHTFANTVAKTTRFFLYGPKDAAALDVALESTTALQEAVAEYHRSQVLPKVQDIIAKDISNIQVLLGGELLTVETEKRRIN